MVTPVDAYLTANRPRFLDELIQFAAIPSVSTDPSYADGMRSAAQWVAERMVRAGIGDVRMLPTARHPAVCGSWLERPGAPTILVYGHYDVQPPDPLDQWQSPPFRPELRTHRLYGRGVSDDKGPMLIPIQVAEAFLAVTGSLPVNVRFLFEGEEEIGSPSLRTIVQEHAEHLAADFALSADGAIWRVDLPSITIASRGITGLEFTLTGAAKDLHSGRHGGAVANPLHAMAQLVASLHSRDGKVAVAGFYDDVVELSPVERSELAALRFSDEDYLRETGAPATFGEPGYSTLERLWTRPTLEVNGMWGGYEGEGSKTVIPHEAHAKVTCRLVPNQHPADICHRLVQHLEQRTPIGVRLSARTSDHDSLPYAIPADHIGIRIAAQVLQETYGEKPATVRMGGTLPVSELFLRVLGIHTVFFSFSTADEDFHAPNEFLRINRYYDGLTAWARYWQLLGAVT